ncbi:MAG: DUF1736 domain-containing protein [bacterium]
MRPSSTDTAVTPPAERTRRPRAWMVGLVLLAAVLPYLNSLTASFAFDDVFIVRDNPAIQLQPAADLLLYVYPEGALYRPLTMLTYAANAALSPEPFGFHLVNVALHALVSLAVLLLALDLLGAPIAALGAALLFAVHPVHSEAVTNVVGRAELLAALGVLTALLAFAQARRSPRRRWLWRALSLAAFAAGMLAKESAITGLGLLAVLDWRLTPGARWRQRLLALSPYAVVAFAYLALRVGVVGSLALPQAPQGLDNPLAAVDAATRLRTAVIVMWRYLSLLVAPLHLSADYSFNQIPLAGDWSDARFLAGLAVLGSLTAAVLLLARRLPRLAVAALFAVVPLALTANVLFPIGTIMGERLLYLPSVGWCLACGLGLAAAMAHRPQVAACAAALLLLAFAARTWLRNGDWQDEPTLFAATVLDAPDSAKAHFNAAIALRAAQHLDEAMAQYRRAVDIYPAYANAALGIGSVYALRDIDAGAISWYERTLSLAPDFANAHLQLGLVRLRRGELDSADAAFTTGLQSEPNNLMLLVSMSSLRLAQGDPWRAAEELARLDRVGTMDNAERERVAMARDAIEVALR